MRSACETRFTYQTKQMVDVVRRFMPQNKGHIAQPKDSRQLLKQIPLASKQLKPAASINAPFLICTTKPMEMVDYLQIMVTKHL